MYFNHPLVKENKIELRSYQLTAAMKAYEKNTLIVLPTGTGKTIIALIATVYWLEKNPNAKIIFMAPTKPLVLQHKKVFIENLKIDENETAVLSGEISPDRRRYLWRRKIIFATPQVVYNDLIRGFVNIENGWMFIFDEAHRAVGNYSYVKIVEYIELSDVKVRIIGLTASPGDKEKTFEIMKNLNIQNIFVLTASDDEVKKYFYGYEIKQVFIQGDMVFNYLRDLLLEYLYKEIDRFNNLVNDKMLFLQKNRISFTFIDEKRKLLDEKYLNWEISRDKWRKLKRILYLILIADRLLSYIEAYSYNTAFEYLLNIKKKARRSGTSAEKEFIGNKEIEEAYLLLENLTAKRAKYPKIQKLVDIIKNQIFERAIIFVSLKNIALEIKEELNKHNIPTELLIGQKRKNSLGLSQKKQIAILYNFKTGIYRVLIATHIGEEGLDIGEVDLVIFYDNPISAIRRIQRMGRTGRKRRGKIFFLIMKQTREEARYWAGLKKEKKLYRELKQIENIDLYQNYEKIDHFINRSTDKEGIKILVDYREREGQIINLLKEKGITIELTNLDLGDYQVGNYLIERKTMADLIESIIDGRIFRQIKQMKMLSDVEAVVVIEGDIKNFLRRAELASYVGTLLSIMLDYGIKVYVSSGPKETSELLYILYKRLTGEKKKTIRLRTEKKPYVIKEIQKYVLAGIPGVDSILADRLLKYFKTLSNIAKASLDELMKVKGVGPELAKRIYETFNKEYT